MIAHITLPTPSGSGTYQSHWLLMASTSSRPLPPSALVFSSAHTGGCGLSSWTRTRIRTVSDSSHRRTGESGLAARDAVIALVKSSLTSSSALSAHAVRCHSHNTCLAWYRAHGTALGRAPSSRNVWSGHSRAKADLLRQGGTGTTGLLHAESRAGSGPLAIGDGTRHIRADDQAALMARKETGRRCGIRGRRHGVFGA